VAGIDGIYNLWRGRKTIISDMASNTPPAKKKKAAKAPVKRTKKAAKRKPTKRTKRKVDPSKYSIPSFLIHGQQHTEQWDYGHHVVPPLSASSTFRLDSATRGEAGFCGFADPELTSPDKPHIYIYERLDEPVRAMLEDRLAAAEGAEMAVAFSSGMAAISAALAHRLKSGDEIIAHPTLYGCTYSLLENWLPRFGIKVRYHDFVNNMGKLRINKRTKAVYCETPANPTLDILDIEAIAARVAEANEGRNEEDKVRFIVDNTFATPACQRPLELGADVIASSLTKGINGFGTDMGGFVATSKRDESSLLMFRKDFGAALAPTPAWRILNFGLPTLSLRTRRQEESAMKIAQFLEQHPMVKFVQYPGLPSAKGYEIARRQMRDYNGNFAPGTLMYFELKGGKKLAADRADALVDWIAEKAYTITLAVSLGQIRTLIERPGGMTHSVLPKEVQKVANIGPGGVRLAIGIEEVDDILLDLDAALKRVK